MKSVIAEFITTEARTEINYIEEFYPSDPTVILLENTSCTQEYTVRTQIYNGNCRAGHVK